MLDEPAIINPAFIPPIDPDEEPAATYPISEDARLSVSTDAGTNPEETDQGDEEVTREQSRMPE